MNIPIKTLQCFLILVETENFTRAAQKCFITQPTLSKIIQRLEESVGETLLIRNNQKVELTQAGQLFEHSAREILGQWHRLQEDMSNLSGLKSGRLRLGVCPMMSSLIIGLLTSYRKRYPGVELQMYEYGGFGCEQALLNNSLDIAFTALPTTHETELVNQPLTKYPLLACLPDGHPLAAKSYLNWQDFEAYPFILYNEDFSLAKLITRLSRKAGVQLNIAFRSGQWDFLATMVEADMGLAILPEPICQKLSHSNLVFRPMQPALTWDLALIWRQNLPLTPAANALLELSKQKA
ncbi:MAG: LysR family transcriptional regulator [Shewanella xiamenensis]|uniref:LysR family transcriptional regulator n=1 Tax=Shewanella xiamenensis TaxID=332186 RepID=A0AAE4PXH5_9GAMM|nr:MULTISPECIES: LysR family transcriptional regulator [Shewanella]KPN76189.1 LysR family transcriptional regulator [Shewanella sp. Sh95]MCD8550976.1 LysR family transcriptional regulator [Shewanella xiamenensis]MCD8560353.1 LysR family transcriptional regulator [Shewanella xiamenensis]MDH1624754.1 LysR family transcriptional regulator [Shewanella xiamenensis]MDV5388848.1 LysR family transcriptional regulator [Shewanella xiamenensis]